MIMKKWGLLGVLALFLAAGVSATYISLSTAVNLDVIINTTSTEANITITNQGDEPAFDVIVEPTFPTGFTGEQINIGNINPNQTVVRTLKIGIPSDATPGRYSMGLLMRYNDVNSYPFTFVTPVKFFYKTAVQSNIWGSMNEVELSGDEKETLTLKIQNRDDKQRQVSIRLYAPNQIAVDEKDKSITLAPNSETTIDFTVSSIGALPGGDYFVFAILDYDEEGKHYSVPSNGRIMTAKERSFMGLLAPVIVVIVLVLVVALLYLQLRQNQPVKAAKKR
ncbi:MAG: NEW3 domain-containing protein [Candidatus Altiarchaeota archaeon]